MTMMWWQLRTGLSALPNASLVSWLIHGADPNAETTSGEVIEFLFDYGASAARILVM